MSFDKHRVLAESILIGDAILAEGQSLDNRFYWTTLTPSDNGLTPVVRSDMYSGIAGICYFLNQLTLSSGILRYRNVADRAFESLLSDSDNTVAGKASFLTGYYSLPFVKSNLPIDPNIGSLKIPIPSEYLNGCSGILVATLHKTALKKASELLTNIDELTGHLIDNCSISRRGLIWDRSVTNILGLCGFSHGASGIAFAFLELSRLFSNMSFSWLAQEILAYENSWFNHEYENWMDLRKGIWTSDNLQEHRTAYVSNQLTFFTAGGNMSAWCHGAPGIGLTRLRAWQLLGDEEYFRDFERAVQKVRENDLTYNPRRTFTLCHGSCGNAELLLEGYRVTGRKEYLEDAYRIAEFAIRQKEELGVYLSGYAQAGMQDDLSLFMGTAGIGYFFLRLLDPSIPSILLPTIDAPPVKVDPKYKNINISLPELKRRVCSRAYGRTLVAMGGNLPSFSEHAYDHIQVELQTVERAAGVSESAAVKDALEYEKIVRELDHSIESFALLHAEMLFGRYEGPLTDEVVLTLSDRVRLVTTQWNWLSDDLAQELQKAPSEVFVLLQALPEKVREIRLSPFAFTVLELFREPVRLDDAWLLCKSQIEMEDEKEASEAHALFIDQIRQAVEARVLVEAKADGH